MYDDRGMIARTLDLRGAVNGLKRQFISIETGMGGNYQNMMDQFTSVDIDVFFFLVSWHYDSYPLTVWRKLPQHEYALVLFYFHTFIYLKHLYIFIEKGKKNFITIFK